MLLHTSYPFYAFSDMVPSSLHVTTPILDPAQYRSKRLRSLFTAHNHYYLGTRTLSTRHMQAHIASYDIYIPASSHGSCKPLSLTMMSTFHRLSFSWLPVDAILPPLAYLILSLSKPAARDNYHNFPISVANPTPNTTGTILTPSRRRRHTTDATQA